MKIVIKDTAKRVLEGEKEEHVLVPEKTLVEIMGIAAEFSQKIDQQIEIELFRAEVKGFDWTTKEVVDVEIQIILNPDYERLRDINEKIKIKFILFIKSMSLFYYSVKEESHVNVYPNNRTQSGIVEKIIQVILPDIIFGEKKILEEKIEILSQIEEKMKEIK